MRYLFVLLLLAGCGTIPPTTVSGNYITTEHGTARFRDALEGAREYCASRGMDVRHLRTDAPYTAISQFECVGR